MEFEIRAYDGQDEVQNQIVDKLDVKKAQLDTLTKSLVGVIKRMIINKEIADLTQKYDKRALELGRQKPSGWHG